MKNFFRVMKGALHIIYPKRCPICDRVLDISVFDRRYPICDRCKDRMEYVMEPVCKRCGKPISNERSEYCQDCTRHTHFFVQGKALWVYKGCVKESVYRLKYSNRQEYGLAYARELADRYGSWIRRKEIQAILPIPLHKKRRRQRGYNQAEIIAKELGRLLELPVYSDWLIRCIHTKPQKELNDKERRDNLKKAFFAVENKISCERILLVDDIYTTGSTIDGAAKALKQEKEREIYFISVSIGRGY